MYSGLMALVHLTVEVQLFLRLYEQSRAVMVRSHFAYNCTS